MGGGAGGRRVPAETLLSQHNDLKIIGPSLSVASLQMSTPRAGQTFTFKGQGQST